LLILVLALAFLINGCREGQETSGEAIKVSLATTPVIYTGLIAVADQKGFFRQAGLDVSIRSDYPAGLQSMQALERGEVQMATGAAFAFSQMLEDDQS
jgi:NitT/TauT family transport system substrate-binding protein